MSLFSSEAAFFPTLLTCSHRVSSRGAVQTTPLIQNPGDPTFYYLSLKGIIVGSTRLPVPESAFALSKGTGGTIIDSGTAITSLPPRVYRLVRDAFAAQLKLPVVAGDTTDTFTCLSAPRGEACRTEAGAAFGGRDDGPALGENYVRYRGDGQHHHLHCHG
ncbi:hypothetical protein E2562_000030 [Oryza meyeriana var. granulata]|uniref:Peptidase A1 domain-containing protein n=1 Tax=Oryza meyeriana var. granulata TaxID=110450 RepID=A0A6G1DB83_9ORYZ|nr:hypothetical protein E2562_000030 [Oryza meyeriana var. granulata]